MVERVAVAAKSGRYEVVVGPGALGELSAAVAGADGVAVISHPRLLALYPLPISADVVLTVPPGERSKSYAVAGRLLSALAGAKFRRGGTIVALGGGVIGDLAGFVAAVYHRGVTLVQVPTTLLAQVDASVGGKVGVDTPDGKNLVGAFLQPTSVLADINTLRTLPRRHFRNGMAEVIKYAFLMDAEFLDTLMTNRNRLEEPLVITKIVAKCCRMKARVVREDERDLTGSRARLNLGHTVGHAIEAELGYKRLLHGEAVSVGMVAEARIAHRLGLCGADVEPVFRDTLRTFGLPTHVPADLDAARLVERMCGDKKAARGKLAMALPRELGRVELVEDINSKTVQKVLEGLLSDG